MSLWQSFVSCSEFRWSTFRLNNFYEEFLRLRIVAETFKPFDALFVPEPRQLPFSIMAYIEFRLFDGALKRPFAAQIFRDATIAVSAERV